MAQDMGGTGGVRAHYTPYGFRFGAALVERVSAIRRSPKAAHHVCIAVKTDADVRVEVYVSPNGRSVRVFRSTRNGERKELT